MQSEYSLWTRQPELGLLQGCKRLGTAFVAFSPLGRGMFGATDPDPATFAGRDIRPGNPRFTGDNYERNREQVAKFRALAGSLGHAPASLATAWVMSRAPHIHAIPGTRTVAHLEELAAGAKIALSPETLAEIEAVLLRLAHGDRYSEAQAVGVERYC